MFLSNLYLTQFKNHETSRFEFQKPIVAFIGKNGVGKTNILDAIYFMAVAKSYFNWSDSALVQFEKDFFRIESTWHTDEDEPLEMICKFHKNKKSFTKNEVPITKLSEILGNIPVVLCTPYDQSLIIGGSEERRGFIDYTLSVTDKEYIQALSAYQKNLEQRNALLKKAETEGLDYGLLSIYNEKLVHFGTQIFKKRKTFISQFEKEVQRVYRILSNEHETPTLTYQSDLLQGNFEDLLEKSKQKDLILQRTTVGIHRDDLDFLLDQNSAKKFSSQGQQKTAIYSLKLAQANYFNTQLEKKPILLLDDLFDKLDPQRGKNILDLLTQMPQLGQIFITDTNKNRIETFAENRSDFQVIEIL